MSAEMVEATLNGRYKIILPKHRADRPEWYTEEGWEKKRLARLWTAIADRKEKNKDGSCKVYYIGAEEGEMPALCRMWGANGLMVEPNERVLPNIKAIWDANNLLPWEILVGFMGNEATAKPDWEKACRAMERIEGEVIGDHGFKELHDHGDIPVYRIDDLNSAGFISPDIITMDVEGSEFEVLKGAERTIRTFKPDILLSLHPEFLIQYWGVYAAEVRKWIKDLGYDEELLDYQHEVHLMYTPREGNDENTPANA